ncbi:MAG TPA: beta-lactamase induction protein [Oleiagrimonas sp.]|nr:beta-lactamase induction protein [Oleiagrimonas sp.]
MTFRFLAVVIALLLVAFVPQVRTWRDLRWFDHWIVQCGNVRGVGRLLLVLAPPVIVVAIVAALLGSAYWLTLVWLAFAVAVLVYTLGPRNLEADIGAVLASEGLVERAHAAQALRVHTDDDAVLSLRPAALVEASVCSALKRRFGVVLWFVVLGPAGALLYRLAQHLGDHADTDVDSRSAARRFADIMDWPAAHLMVFAMALVSDFDAVIGTWRAWHKSPNRSPWTFDAGFLGAVARAGVEADVEAGDDGAPDTDNPMLELLDARRLLLRVLLVWLAVLALLVLAGWVA